MDRKGLGFKEVWNFYPISAPFLQAKMSPPLKVQSEISAYTPSAYLDTDCPRSAAPLSSVIPPCPPP